MTRLQTGFWPFKADRVDLVGEYKASAWTIENVELKWKQRIEHLTARVEAQEIAKSITQITDMFNPKQSLPTNTWVISNPDEGETPDSMSEDEDLCRILQQDISPKVPEEDELCQILEEDSKSILDKDSCKDLTFAQKMIKQLSQFAPSLAPPPSTRVEDAANYFNTLKSENCIHLGRKMIVESSKRQLKGTLWMYDEKLNNYSEFPSLQSPDFPLKSQHLMPILELLGMTQKHIQPLTDFFQVQLCPGFPIQMEIPLASSALNVLITFHNLNTKDIIPDSLFEIPSRKQGYRPGEVIT